MGSYSSSSSRPRAHHVGRIAIVHSFPLLSCCSSSFLVVTVTTSCAVVCFVGTGRETSLSRARRRRRPAPFLSRTEVNAWSDQERDKAKQQQHVAGCGSAHLFPFDPGWEAATSRDRPCRSYYCSQGIPPLSLSLPLSLPSRSASSLRFHLARTAGTLSVEVGTPLLERSTTRAHVDWQPRSAVMRPPPTGLRSAATPRPCPPGVAPLQSEI
ncbi:hypothetical protein V8E36_000123 [Tilletia maclaganii]